MEALFKSMDKDGNGFVTKEVTLVDNYSSCMKIFLQYLMHAFSAFVCKRYSIRETFKNPNHGFVP